MEEYLYDVGDIVSVRDDLRNFEHIGRLSIVDRMKDLSGKQVTITQRVKGAHGSRYMIKEDGEIYFWSDKCFSDSKWATIYSDEKYDTNEINVLYG